MRYADRVDTEVRAAPGGPVVLKVAMANPGAQDNCRLCVSGYECMFLPFHGYVTTLDLTTVLQGRGQQLTRTCQALDSRTTRRILPFRASAGRDGGG